ncbi:MAG: antibiotic biosynthesis monooxygenase [Paucimonas sp.]|nr:antibiotic biosynthesis monooxygenase [Paucimonas sp.]
MFAVIFEVEPKAEQWDAYLGYGKMLRPELEQIEGFLENARYRSLTRHGWLVSVSTWHDEKALVRWRTKAVHHEVQQKGRDQVFRDYHLRVGQVTRDNRQARGQALPEQRLDETEVGAGSTLVLVDCALPVSWIKDRSPHQVATRLGLELDPPGLISWDVFEAVLNPGDAILLMTWRDAAAAEATGHSLRLPPAARLRHVRIIRDYGMFDRREAPQYYPDVKRYSR